MKIKKTKPCDAELTKELFENDDIKRIVVSEVKAFKWECPECGYINLQDKECGYINFEDKHTEFVCEGCGEIYEVDGISN